MRASIAHHAEQRQRALTASVEIRKLLAERADLLREVNTLRQKWSRSGPKTLNREEEQARQKDRQEIFDVETECFNERTTSRLDSTDRDTEQITAFLQLEQERLPHDGASAAPPFDDSFTSPTPSQITRFLDHVDSDLLQFLPS